MHRRSCHRSWFPAVGEKGPEGVRRSSYKFTAIWPDAYSSAVTQIAGDCHPVLPF